jgi:hypothetical protein
MAASARHHNLIRQETVTMARQHFNTPETQNPPTPTEPEASAGGNGAAGEPVSSTDVFDRLDSFRLRQSFDRIKVRRPLATVGIRKPRAHEWFQAHPDYRYEGTLFRALEEGLSEEWFFPTTAEGLAVLEDLSPTGLRNVCIFWWINRKKNTFIWPVTLADSDGRQNDWHASMFEMLSVHGRCQWCRIEAGDGGYDPTIAENEEAELPAPEWPTVQHFGEVLRVAFKKGGRVIDGLDHPLVRRLRG